MFPKCSGYFRFLQLIVPFYYQFPQDIKTWNLFVLVCALLKHGHTLPGKNRNLNLKISAQFEQKSANVTDGKRSSHPSECRPGLLAARSGFGRYRIEGLLLGM
jgi:hypothetical protein